MFRHFGGPKIRQRHPRQNNDVVTARDRIEEGTTEQPPGAPRAFLERKQHLETKPPPRHRSYRSASAPGEFTSARGLRHTCFHLNQFNAHALARLRCWAFGQILTTGPSHAAIERDALLRVDDSQDPSALDKTHCTWLLGRSIRIWSCNACHFVAKFNRGG